jgi:hypothetical protein
LVLFVQSFAADSTSPPGRSYIITLLLPFS